jgi:small subunit ribosomal protein S20
MANHSATKKSARKNAKRNERNRYQGKTTRNAIRLYKVIDNKADASEKMPDIASRIDKLAKRGIIHRNKAANLKRKLTKSIQLLEK